MSVSVIITSYNRANIIANAVSSAATQTLKPKEIIVIDNVSKDNSMEVLNTLSEKIPNLKIFQNEKNLGYNYSLEKGVQLAQSKYVAFLDSDDLWGETYLENMISRLNQAQEINKSVAFCAATKKDLGFETASDQRIKLAIQGKGLTNMSRIVVDREMLLTMLPHPALPTEEELKYFCQDDIFWFAMTQKFRFCLCHDATIIQGNTKISLSKNLKIMAQAWELFYLGKESYYFELGLQEELLAHLRRVTFKYILAGNLIKAVQLEFKLFKMSPRPSGQRFYSLSKNVSILILTRLATIIWKGLPETSKIVTRKLLKNKLSSPFS